MPVADVKIRSGILQSTLTNDLSTEGVVAGGRRMEAVLPAGVHASRLQREEGVVTSSVTVALLSDVTSMGPTASFQLCCSVLALKVLSCEGTKRIFWCLWALYHCTET